MDIVCLSNQYDVKLLAENDVSTVYELCRKNTLYYQYCPPFVSKKSIVNDMNALPPNKHMRDKYYIGYYDGKNLVAIMDLILFYPDKKTAYIGFFMTDVSVQNKGIGSKIIEDLASYLTQIGISKLCLAWVKDNLQARRFWNKNKFLETGEVYTRENYTATLAQRDL